MRPHLTVLIPVYNEEKNVESAINKISEKLKKFGITFEILIVDDGSSDNTGKIVSNIMRSVSYVRIISHASNLGPGSGILTGIKEALGEFIIFIPADIAMDLDQLPKYINASGNADVVVGLRSDRRDYSSLRKLVSFINIMAIKILFRMKERQFNYISLYRTEIFKKINIEARSVFVTAEIMIKARDLGYRLVEIEIDYVPREYGSATGSSVKSILKTLRDMLKFWTNRLKVPSK